MKMKLSIHRFFLAVCLFCITQCSTLSTTPSASESKRPLLILVSFDGLRWDYLNPKDTPEILAVGNQGVRAKSLVPIFPSVTFPNHYTIVTGLYAEHHGIISNEIYNPKNHHWFKLSDPSSVNSQEWWQGEPLWITAQRQGQIAGAVFWVGSTALIHGQRPRYFLDYNPKVTRAERVNQLLKWIDLPESERPNFFMIYFSDVDEAGHRFGPGSPEVHQALRHVDSALKQLQDGLAERHLLEETNLVLVSDHGMANQKPEQYIPLDRYIDLSDVIVAGKGAFAGLFPKHTKEDAIYMALKKAHPHLHVYRKNEIPKQYHYQDNSLIPPLLAVCDEGWGVVATQQSVDKTTRGMHGFDPLLTEMHGIFLARGPAFKKEASFGSLLNVDLYELMSHVLKLKPAPNDGDFDRVKGLLR